MIYDVNEKYIAVSQVKKLIEIYEIPLEIKSPKSKIKPESVSIIKEKKLFCKIEASHYIKDLKLNPNHLNILLVGTQKEIEFFIFPETSQEETIKNPRFIFNNNTSPFESAVFNPFNSHIIASSFNDYTIQIWSIIKPFIQKIICSYVPTQMKWYKNGNLLGFIDKETEIKIYNLPQKKIILIWN